MANTFVKHGIRYDDHHFKDAEGKVQSSPPRECHHATTRSMCHAPTSMSAHAGGLRTERTMTSTHGKSTARIADSDHTHVALTYKPVQTANAACRRDEDAL